MEEGVSATQTGIDEQTLINHVKCELIDAIKTTLEIDAANRQRLISENKPDLAGYSIDWLRDWGATVTLKLTVDEKSTLAPGITFTKPLENIVYAFSSGGSVTAKQSRSVGLGASLSSDATRIETISFYYLFSDYLSPDKRLDCSDSGDSLLKGNLRIVDFLNEKITVGRAPNTVDNKPGKSPFSTFTYQVTFVVTKSGNVTPSWSLARVSANTSGNFLSGQRVNTDDLTITMGPPATDSKGEVGPNQDVRDAHLAALIGQSVATALQSQQQ